MECYTPRTPESKWRAHGRGLGWVPLDRGCRAILAVQMDESKNKKTWKSNVAVAMTDADRPHEALEAVWNEIIRTRKSRWSKDQNLHFTSGIWGLHSVDVTDSGLLGCLTRRHGFSLSTFRTKHCLHCEESGRNNHANQLINPEHLNPFHIFIYIYNTYWCEYVFVFTTAHYVTSITVTSL